MPIFIEEDMIHSVDHELQWYIQSDLKTYDAILMLGDGLLIFSPIVLYNLECR